MGHTSPRVLLLTILLLSVVSCSSRSDLPIQRLTPSTTGSPMWVVGWSNSPENAIASSENAGGVEQTFRFFFLPTVNGTQERVRFSNFFGTTPITVGAARLALATGSGPAIDTTHDAPLTFGGNTGITIQPGQTVVSDSVNIAYTLGQKMAVSMYVRGTFPPLTQHDAQVETNYSTPANGGNTTADAVGTSLTQTTPEWFLLSGVDVYGPYQGTVALFGSSSIDGHASDYGDTNSYPVANAPVAGQDNDRPSDWLARQLNVAGYNLGVANAGVLGDPAGSIASIAPGITDGIDRMNRDVLQLPGIKAVIIYLGSIDIRSADCKSAPDVEAALSDLVSQANAAGVRVILGTLPPSAYCANSAAANFGPVPSASSPYAGDINPGPENPGGTQRRLVNDWIRTSGAQLPGVVGVADFDKAIADPAHPDFMQPNLNSGDNFHPNGVGYGIQSTAIPLGSILGQ